MKLATLIQSLTTRLQQPLPGRKAQLALYSETYLDEYDKRFGELERASSPENSRQSSVLILLYEKDDRIFIPFIQRPVYDGVHSGQIGLPGGKVDPEDVDVIATALREAQEEIGTDPNRISILGALSPIYIAPSRFWVNVILGYHTGIPIFIPDPREVSAIIEFPLEHIQEKMQVEEREVIRSKEFRMKSPGYVFEESFIWGATAMILSELKTLLKE